MERFVALRDRRLRGLVPVTPQVATFHVDGSVPLNVAFTAIKSTANGKKLSALFVLCHGYAGENTRAGVCADAGGMGLQLGRENVLHRNVVLWSALKNVFSNIIVYSCGAGDTQAGNVGTFADGRYLMGALAIHTNATVYAANRIQWYSIKNGDGSYDFGAWEGTLYRFDPSGSAAQPVGRAAIELQDVLTGSFV